MSVAQGTSPYLPAEFERLIDELKKDVDRTLIRENLRLSVEERLRQLMSLQEFAEGLRNAGEAARAKV